MRTLSESRYFNKSFDRRSTNFRSNRTKPGHFSFIGQPDNCSSSHSQRNFGDSKCNDSYWKSYYDECHQPNSNWRANQRHYSLALNDEYDGRSLDTKSISSTIERRQQIKIGSYDGDMAFETFIAEFRNAAQYNK